MYRPASETLTVTDKPVGRTLHSDCAHCLCHRLIPTRHGWSNTHLHQRATTCPCSSHELWLAQATCSCHPAAYLGKLYQRPETPDLFAAYVTQAVSCHECGCHFPACSRFLRATEAHRRFLHVTARSHSSIVSLFAMHGACHCAVPAHLSFPLLSLLCCCCLGVLCFLSV